MEKQSSVIEKRRAKIEQLKSNNINLFPNDIHISHTIEEIDRFVAAHADSLTENEPQFSTAGRIMAVNRFGKAAFIRFRDRSGSLQAYIRKDRVGTEAFDLFKQMDIGDFIGITGGMFQTRTGEWTLLAHSMALAAKSVRPLPEKFHGLKDPEKRYRQRYIDLIMNADVRDIFIKRSQMIQSIRAFLVQRDFLEVETPMMQVLPGGAEATPFVTHHNALDMDLYLRIAPELYLKRLVVGGFERVFEINRNFRNEGVSTRHNPEFTMLEFYQAYATYTDLMALTEQMLGQAAEAVLGTRQLRYQGHQIDFSAPWRRLPLLDSLVEIGGLEPDALTDKERLIAVANQRGVVIGPKGGRVADLRLGKIITKLFDALVEPKLIQPTFVTGYPVEVSPLSRRSDDQPELTERFELFIAGAEIANGFSELNDPQDQRERFQQQVQDRMAGDNEAHPMDEDYIQALEYGMPPTAGEGIGMDRLAMLFTDSASIREVILFPHMKNISK